MILVLKHLRSFIKIYKTLTGALHDAHKPFACTFPHPSPQQEKDMYEQSTNHISLIKQA